MVLQHLPWQNPSLHWPRRLLSPLLTAAHSSTSSPSKLATPLTPTPSSSSPNSPPSPSATPPLISLSSPPITSSRPGSWLHAPPELPKITIRACTI
ncbi:hypothetical protein M0R45_008280 [Rubus argutus]|uniref:Uncharacterized protein n=1 Tax=Rubus argutus TaxID=59490 RepID=A0AAW1Y299_RUBAR